MEPYRSLETQMKPGQSFPLSPNTGNKETWPYGNPQGKQLRLGWVLGSLREAQHSNCISMESKPIVLAWGTAQLVESWPNMWECLGFSLAQYQAGFFQPQYQ